MITTHRLTKRYGDHVAVEGLNLDVQRAQIYGFLGPNGAGKTTTIHMLLNLIQPTSGERFVLGEKIQRNSFEFRGNIGVVAEEPAESSGVTGWEHVLHFARIQGVRNPVSRMQELFTAMDLWDARNAFAHDYSHGMRQKLSLIRALVHDPQLLILDEPVSGLDPYGIRQVREAIYDFRDRGGTVFISSHILSEIEQAADRVGIMHHGHLLAEDSLAGLRARLGVGRNILIKLETPNAKFSAAMLEAPYVRSQQSTDNAFDLVVDDSVDVRPHIFQAAVNSGAVIVEMRDKELTLEEAFVTITNQNVERLAGTAIS